MIDDLKRLAQKDTRLNTLFEEVQEYAHLYLLAKQRQKGCDEMGEVVTLRAEVRWTVEKMLEYCRESNFSFVNSSANLESLVEAILKRTIT